MKGTHGSKDLPSNEASTKPAGTSVEMEEEISSLSEDKKTKIY